MTALERFSVSPKVDSESLSTKKGYNVLAIQIEKSQLYNGTYFLIADDNKLLNWYISDAFVFNRIEDIVGVEVHNG